MERYIYRTLFVLLAMLSWQAGHAQNILSESFDGTSLPSGWIDTIYTSPSSGCGTYGCKWLQETASVGSPGPSAHTGTGYMFYDSRYIDHGGSSELSTPSVDFSTYTGGYNTVSFWMYRDNSGLSYFDSITVYVNTSASAGSATRLGSVNRVTSHDPVVSSAGWYQYTFRIPTSFSGSTNYIIFKAFSDYGYDMYLDDVSVDHIPACSGTPSISGVSPTGPLTVCPGSSVTLKASMSPEADRSYQWQMSYNGGSTWRNVPGDTALTDSFYVWHNVQIHMIATCNNSGLSATSSAVTVNMSTNVHIAFMPYEQDFESWSSRCDDLELPDSNWTSYPTTGNNSWRRDDQGFGHGGWDSATLGGDYTPVSILHDHSARFHSYAGLNGAVGNLDLFVNCYDTISGDKELHYYYYNPASSDDDTMNIYVSTDSGRSFTRIARETPVGEWVYRSLTITSNIPRTIIRFSGLGHSAQNDIGLDDVQVVPPCNDTPTAGTIDSIPGNMICANKYFMLRLSGSSASAGLTYWWQKSTDSLTWVTDSTDTSAVYYGSTNVSAYYRVVVECRKNGYTDTSAPYFVTVKPFYYCYCDAINNPGTRRANVGNITIAEQPWDDTVLNNGVASPTYNNSSAVNVYSDYDSLTPVTTLYLDSLYKVSTALITQYSSLGSSDTLDMHVWIDWNHDGSFERTEEVYWANGLGSLTTLVDTFRVDDTAMLGITGMRVKLGVNETYPLDPCGVNNAKGETEDYLINIDYRKCTGPTNAGKVVTSNTVACRGHNYMVVDTTHEHKRSGLTWIWQQSADSVLWFDVSGSTDKDTLFGVMTGKTWFRVRMVCTYGNDTTYSDTAHINISPAYKCYCVSMANGGAKDSSDAGAFSIDSFAFSKGGPHLHNGAAVYGYEDYTSSIIDLYADSTYTANLYYILKGGADAKARVTLFMDFDNNMTYDVPAERVWSEVITPPVMLLSKDITIPDYVVSNVGTGMRLVINNNYGPNSPSDIGCGTYTSGETIDFAVVFKRVWPEGVGNINGIENLMLYPNPTDGRFTLHLDAKSTIEKLQVVITDMTGREVLHRVYEHTNGVLQTQLDLSGQAPGMYFVTIEADGERMIRKLIIK